MYVEAHKEAHVKEALRGLRMVFASKPPRLVPLREMVDAISVARGTEKAIGAWALRGWRAGCGLAAGLSRAVLEGLPWTALNAARCTLPLLTQPAEVGSWVRIKGGLYKGDLAKVADVEPSTQARGGGQQRPHGGRRSRRSAAPPARGRRHLLAGCHQLALPSRAAHAPLFCCVPPSLSSHLD